MKLKRLTALLLSVSMLLSTNVFAADGNGSTIDMVNGNQAVRFGTEDASTYNQKLTVRNEVYMVRVSLINGETGYPIRDDKILSNPINCVNPKVYWYGKGHEIEEGACAVWRAADSCTNSRREYTTWDVNATGAHANKPLQYDYTTQPSVGTRLPSHDATFKTQNIRDDLIADPCIPDFLGDTKSFYQSDNSYVPEKQAQWSTMSNIDYFNDLAESTFISKDNTTGKAVPDLYYRMLAHMSYNDMPSEQMYSDTVANLYEEYIINRGCRLLIEPMFCIQNEENSPANALFGDPNNKKYIFMTFADLGAVEDANTAVNYGYTDKCNLEALGKIVLDPSHEHYKPDGTPGVKFPTYNWILQNQEHTVGGQKVSNWFYEKGKMVLQPETECNIFSVKEGAEGGKVWNSNAPTAFKTWDLKANNASYAQTLRSKLGADTYTATKGPLANGEYGAFVKGFAYPPQMYGKMDVAPGASQWWNADYTGDAHGSHFSSPAVASTDGMLDPCAALDIAGQQVLPLPSNSKIDFKVNELVGEGGQTGQLTLSDGRKLPIFKNAFVGSTNTVYFKASSKINIMNDENIQVTKWLDDVLLQPDENIHLPIRKNNGDDNIDINELQPPSSTQPNFIPGLTLTTLTTTYVDEKGEPIQFNQVDGTSASAGTSILAQVDDPTKKNSSKLFLCNLDFYSYDQTEAQPQVLSVKKATFIANIGCF